MKNKNIITLIIELFSSVFSFIYEFFIFLFKYTISLFFSILAASFNLLSKFGDSFFSIFNKSAQSKNNFFFNQFENFFFTYFFAYYFFVSKHFKILIYFIVFVAPYFLFIGVELTNESLLLACIIFTLFLLYNSVRDLLVSSLNSDIKSIKMIIEKRLAVIDQIYLVEHSIVMQQAATIEIIESCLAHLSAFEENSSAFDSANFDTLLNESFSESIFNYFILEIKDEFSKEYFFIDNQFEETFHTYIEETF